MSRSKPEQHEPPARLRAVSTFFGAPVADLEDLRPGVVAAIGVYCDHFCAGRPGGRFAARQLRYTSTASTAKATPGVVDLGDFNVFPLEPGKTLDVLCEQSRQIGAAGAKLFAIGADFSVSPAIVKGLLGEVGTDGLAIIRISRRLDLLPLSASRSLEPQRSSATNELSALLPGGLSAIALLGGRGVVTAQEWQCAATAIVVPAHELMTTPVQAISSAKSALQRVAKRFYLSVDVDVLAPRFGSVAIPNTQGGLSLAQLLHIVEQFDTMPFVGAELTGHVPDLDVPGRMMTSQIARLAGKMLDCLVGRAAPCH